MICDLAETYHIFEYRRVPVRLLGTLVAGLGANSRVHQRITEQEVPTDIFLQAAIVDELRMIVYLLDGNKNKKMPEPITVFSTLDVTLPMVSLTPIIISSFMVALYLTI